MLCVSGQKKICEDKPKIRKVIQDFQKWGKKLLHSKKHVPRGHVRVIWGPVGVILRSYGVTYGSGGRS